MTASEGPFEFTEPVPTLDRPRLLIALQPWIDIGSVGTMALGFLEQLFGRRGDRQVGPPRNLLRLQPLPPHALPPGRRAPRSRPQYLPPLRPLGRWGLAFPARARAALPRGGLRRWRPRPRSPLRRASVHSHRLHVCPHPAHTSTGRRRRRKQRTTPRTAPTSRRKGKQVRGARQPSSPRCLNSPRTKASRLGSVIVQLPAYIQLERDYCGTEALLDILSRVYSLSSEPWSLCARKAIDSDAPWKTRWLRILSCRLWSLSLNALTTPTRLLKWTMKTPRSSHPNWKGS